MTSAPLWRRKLEEVFGLDVRSLALLRVGVAVMLLWDVFIRYQDLHAHYSDEGVLPLALLTASHVTPTDGILPISVHLLGDGILYQSLLFYFEGLVALALLIGWQTRWATVLGWFLTISLHSRNPMVCQGGDAVLRLLLFWGMFLPLGACWSVDAMARPRPPARVLSMATAAHLLQVCLIFWFAALVKYDPAWRSDGDGVYRALVVGHFTTWFGDQVMRSRELMTFLTYGTLVQEGLVPFLLFIPWKTWAFRLVVVFTFVAFHAGLGLCMELGNFEPVCMIAWLSLLPTEFWDWLTARTSRAGWKVVYDAESGPLWEAMRFWTTVLMLRSVEEVRAQEQAAWLKRARDEGSWLVVDREGRVFSRGEALSKLIQASPAFWWLGWVVPRGLSEWLAGARKKEPGERKPEEPPRELPPAVKPLGAMTTFVLAALLLYLIFWNFATWNEPHKESDNPVLAGMLHFRDAVSSHFPTQNAALGFALGLDQSWYLFAPKPGTVHGWIIIEGTLRDGTTVDLMPFVQKMGDAVPLSFERPARIADTYTNSRWRKYFMNLIGMTPDKFVYRHAFAVYVARLWNADHQNEPSKQLRTLKVYLMRETTQPNYEPVTLDLVRLVKLNCEAENLMAAEAVNLNPIEIGLRP